MKVRNLIAIVMFVVLLAACGEEILGPDPENTPEKNFDLLWEDFDGTYPLFDYGEIDWDALYQKYRTQVTHQTSDLELYTIFCQMLGELNDEHISLESSWGSICSISYKTQQDWQIERHKIETVKRKLLKNRYQFPSTQNTPSGQRIRAGFLTEDLGYIGIDSFDANITFRMFTINFTEGFEVIDQILEEFKSVKGLVVDVRDNTGGSRIAAEFVANRFADKKRLYGYVAVRNDPWHSDLDLFPLYIEPDGKMQFTKPVALLTNGNTVSAGEMFTEAMREFPHVTVVGQTTAGNTVGRVNRELPNGFIYTLPLQLHLTKDKEIFERVGLSPDEPFTGLDILNHAIELLNAGAK